MSASLSSNSQILCSCHMQGGVGWGGVGWGGVGWGGGGVFHVVIIVHTSLAATASLAVAPDYLKELVCS